MKLLRELLLMLAIPVAAIFVLGLVQLFARTEVAEIADQLVIAGVLAYGIVYKFFM